MLRDRASRLGRGVRSFFNRITGRGRRKGGGESVGPVEVPTRGSNAGKTRDYPKNEGGTKVDLTKKPKASSGIVGANPSIGAGIVGTGNRASATRVGSAARVGSAPNIGGGAKVGNTRVGGGSRAGSMGRRNRI